MQYNMRCVKPLGRVDKGIRCSVFSCNRKATRSISAEKVRSAGFNFDSNEKRVYLCKEHYKNYKRKTKKDKILDKWRYGV